MKKSIIAVVLLSTLVFCQDKEKNTLEIDEVTVTKTILNENDFDISYGKVLKSLKKNDKEETLRLLSDSIKYFKKETEKSKGKAKKTTDEGLKALEDIKIQFAKGTVKDLDKEFRNAFFKAEKGLAHKLIVETEDIFIVPESISQSEPYFSRALNYFKSIAKQEKDIVKLEADSIILAGEKIEAKLHNAEKVSVQDIKKFYNETKVWMEKHI